MKRGLDKGTLEYCLVTTEHHADWSKFSPPLDQHGKYRMGHIEASLRQARKQLSAIAELAEKTSNQPLLALLEEEFEFGIK
jgi:hypothetical protein